MGAPSVGTVVDGYRFDGGNPNDQNAWTPVGKAGQVYADTLMREQAKDDIDKLTAASQGQRDAYGLEATADRAIGILNDDTPTGPYADTRIDLGRMLGGTPLAALPGIPNARQTQNLEQVRNVGSQGALGDVSKLKGPLSEKELAFIQRLQVDPNATKATNLGVAQMQRWAARRQAGYGAALKSWTKNLGSPSAMNANGLDFDSWWGQYSGQRFPMPGSGQAPKGVGAGRTPVKVTSPAEARALPVGTVFITPDGKRKVR